MARSSWKPLKKLISRGRHLAPHFIQDLSYNLTELIATTLLHFCLLPTSESHAHNGRSKRTQFI